MDNAVKLYSAGSTEKALVAEWEEIEPASEGVGALKVSAETPEKVTPMSIKRKKYLLRCSRPLIICLRSSNLLLQYEDSMLDDYGIQKKSMISMPVFIKSIGRDQTCRSGRRFG